MFPTRSRWHHNPPARYAGEPPEGSGNRPAPRALRAVSEVSTGWDTAETVHALARHGLDRSDSWRRALPDAIAVAERIRVALATAEFTRIALGLPVSISTGATQLQPGMTAADLFHAADTQLYHAKRDGRDRVAACSRARKTGNTRRPTRHRRSEPASRNVLALPTPSPARPATGAGSSGSKGFPGFAREAET